MDRLDEWTVLDHFALRFDGYRYLEDYPFDHQEAMQRFYDTGDWLLSQAQKHAVYFLMQRSLRFGNDTLPQTDPFWKAYRTLFLSLCWDEVPREYRSADFYPVWEHRFGSKIDECFALVRAAHESTTYNSADEAGIDD